VIARDNSIILNDGRALGFAEFGDSKGQAIMYFHGWPSSRLEAGLVESAAQRLQLRIIAPDRPGFGLSDFKPSRKLLDWPADVIELADALELDRFSIMGLSGGGPYAAVCALKIPQRLRAVGIINGSVPADAPAAVEGMRPLNLRLLQIGRFAPWLFRLFSWQVVRALKRNPDSYFDQLMHDLPKPDRDILAQGEIRECLINAAVEAFRKGSRGAALENALYARPWGFNLQEITKEVYIWHGDLDTNTPGRYLASAIPNSYSSFYADEGHISLLINHMEEILRTFSLESSG
jgi:pimeloyl-ACP methyl ester carboxylesterase